MSLRWQKSLVSPVYRYVWLSNRPCRISFIYSKNNKGPNIDPWGTTLFMVPSSKNTLSNETKIALLVREEWNHFIVLPEQTNVLHFILWYKVSKTIWISIKIIPLSFTFQHSLKSCPLTETDMYLWNDFLQSLIDECTTIHFSEDNLVTDQQLFFLSPLASKVTEKKVYKF